MRIASMLLGVLFVLSNANTIKINEAATGNNFKEQPEYAGSVSSVQQAPPTHFFTYRLPWNGKVEMREEELLAVGELAVDCGPNASRPPVFELMSPSPDFVRIEPIPCTFQNQARARVIVFPRRGDAGKYEVRMWAGTCGEIGEFHGFTVKVKKARQD